MAWRSRFRIARSRGQCKDPHSAMDPILIIGAGQAGIQIAETLRQEHYSAPIVLLGAEPHGPYNRPPLSKKWLLERHDPAQLAIRGIEAIRRREIDLQLNCEVAAIDPAQHTVQLADGRSLRYAGLAITTGARVRLLPGPPLRGVFGVRTLDDAQALAAAFEECVRRAAPLVVIGGGFIGLEVAATARKRGLEVIVLEGLGRLMSRVVAPIVSEAAARVHQAHGVQLKFGVQVESLVGVDGHVTAVRTAGGLEYPAGCVVIGIGVIPDDRLAQAAGLACDRGIIVDACARTSAPSIVAAGDCTARRLADGTLLRLESVHNAIEQGKSAAMALLGRERPFTATPWFWSDQYDVKLQMVGLSHGYDQVVTRGDVDKPAFSAFYYRGGRLIAVDSLSRIGDHMVSRKLLDNGLSPLPAQASDAAFELASLLKPQATSAS
jgi:3-phenylpropionate/trans-cinnamate dioxygenase ferredoxin reductase component